VEVYDFTNLASPLATILKVTISHGDVLNIKRPASDLTLDRVSIFPNNITGFVNIVNAVKGTLADNKRTNRYADIQSTDSTVTVTNDPVG